MKKIISIILFFTAFSLSNAMTVNLNTNNSKNVSVNAGSLVDIKLDINSNNNIIYCNTKISDMNENIISESPIVISSNTYSASSTYRALKSMTLEYTCKDDVSTATDKNIITVNGKAFDLANTYIEAKQTTEDTSTGKAKYLVIDNFAFSSYDENLPFEVEYYLDGVKIDKNRITTSGSYTSCINSSTIVKANANNIDTACYYYTYINIEGLNLTGKKILTENIVAKPNNQNIYEITKDNNSSSLEFDFSDKYLNKTQKASLDRSVIRTVDTGSTNNFEIPFDDKPCETLDKNVTNKSSKELIKTLQRILIKKGYLKINSPTGTFGPATIKAIKAFQKENKISQTGAIGPMTRAKLNSTTCSI